MNLKRVLGVTAFVAVLGAAGGAAGGVVIAIITYGHAILIAPEGAVIRPNFLAIAAFASLVGAAFGVLLGPIFAWTLLRRVPLWRAIGETALAAAIGAGAGWVFSAAIAMPFAAALGLSSAAAIRLSIAERRSRLRSLPSVAS